MKYLVNAGLQRDSDTEQLKPISSIKLRKRETGTYFVCRWRGEVRRGEGVRVDGNNECS